LLLALNLSQWLRGCLQFFKVFKLHWFNFILMLFLELLNGLFEITCYLFNLLVTELRRISIFNNTFWFNDFLLILLNLLLMFHEHLTLLDQGQVWLFLSFEFLLHFCNLFYHGLLLFYSFLELFFKLLGLLLFRYKSNRRSTFFNLFLEAFGLLHQKHEFVLVVSYFFTSLDLLDLSIGKFLMQFFVLFPLLLQFISEFV